MCKTKGSLSLLGAALLSNLMMSDFSFAGDLSFVRADVDVQMAPSAVSVGDFNGDGTEDLAVLGQTHLYSGGTLSVLLGGGDGTFGEPITFDCCGEPRSFATGDFNGDGILDVVIPFRNVYPSPDGVAILLGNGDGTFRHGQTLYGDQYDPPHSTFVFVAVGDFNLDGLPDLAVANNTSEVWILLGTGDDRLFSAGQSFEVGGLARSLVVGDFNRDGRLDLAVVNQSRNNVSILMGNGDGTFQPSRNFAVKSSPYSIAVGDFNGDSIEDLAVGSSTSNTVSILIGIGDGGFEPASSVPAGETPTFVAIGDFNGDGVEDLAVSNRASNEVGILLGNGDGTFQARQGFPVGVGPSGLAVADFNQDGLLDLAVSNFSFSSHSVSVLLNHTQP
jgi:hypothetical protein